MAKCTRRNAPLRTNQPCTLCEVYGHYTFECPLMGCAKQAIQNEAQQAANAAHQAQPNPAPQGPPPMVLQNPFLVQGLVAIAPPPQANPNAPGAPPTINTGVHHLLAMTTEEVNLQTRHNHYGTTTEPADTLAALTSKIVNLPLQLPPFPCSPICRIANNATTRATVSYSIVDDLAQTPTAMFALEVLKMCPTQ